MSGETSSRDRDDEPSFVGSGQLCQRGAAQRTGAHARGVSSPPLGVPFYPPLTLPSRLFTRARNRNAVACTSARSSVVVIVRPRVARRVRDRRVYLERPRPSLRHYLSLARAGRTSTPSKPPPRPRPLPSSHPLLPPAPDPLGPPEAVLPPALRAVEPAELAPPWQGHDDARQVVLAVDAWGWGGGGGEGGGWWCGRAGGAGGKRGEGGKSGEVRRRRRGRRGE